MTSAMGSPDGDGNSLGCEMMGWEIARTGDHGGDRRS